MSNGAMVMSESAHLSRVDLSTRFTPEQEQIILDTCCGGAPASEARALIAVAAARGLNPILGECYFVKRYDSQTKKDKWAVQASIDSFRIKAEQTGLYAGQDEPEYEYNDRGEVVLARVRVWRKDWPRPAVGVARWDEYVQTTREGDPTKFWRTMPHNQLAKCAEALALRKAFPAVLAKVYAEEEMGQADNETPLNQRRLGTTQKAPELPAARSDAETYEAICQAIDAAESKGALNKVAAMTRKAKADGKLVDADYTAIVRASNAKAALLADRPSEPRPPSEPPPSGGG
jgi:phage recombination protein Bet